MARRTNSSPDIAVPSMRDLGNLVGVMTGIEERVAGYVDRMSMAVFDTKSDGFTVEGLPRFRVSQLIHVNPGEIEPIRDLTIEQIYNHRNALVGGYTTRGYITQETQRINPDIDTLTNGVAKNVVTKLVDGSVEAYEKAYFDVNGKRPDKNKIEIFQEKTTIETSKMIDGILRPISGGQHQILSTFRVGDVEATEVIPAWNSIDPLFVQIKRGGVNFDRANKDFQTAFMSAMTGRLIQMSYRPRPTDWNIVNPITFLDAGRNMAGIACETISIDARLRSASKLNLAECLMLGEIAHGGALVTGFGWI